MYIFALNGQTRTLKPIGNRGRVGDLLVFDAGCYLQENPLAFGAAELPPEPLTFQLVAVSETEYKLQNIGESLGFILDISTAGLHLYPANEWLRYTRYLIYVSKEATEADVLFPSTRVSVEIGEDEI